MSKYVFGFWFSVLMGLTAGSAAWAKPADLPAQNDIQCPDCGETTPARGSIIIGLDLFTGGVTVKVEIAKAAPALDALTPTLMPAVVEQILKSVGETIKSIRAADKIPESAEARELQARRLFESAEQMRKNGQYQRARSMYQRVHLLTPTSREGRLAIDRLQQIEERLRDAAEEAGQDDPEALFRQIQQNTVPLGLVEMSY